MNLAKLFKMQKELDARILAKHPPQEGEDRLAKKILALLVELGELANCWRGFKYWSNDQEPRIRDLDIKSIRKIRDGQITDIEQLFKNPLLEEYVDGLHFFLSIGNDFSIDENTDFTPLSNHDVMTQIAILYKRISDFWWEVHDNTGDPIITYYFAFERYLGLSEALGFTWEEVEQAYMRKHKINLQRQESGY